MRYLIGLPSESIKLFSICGIEFQHSFYLHFFGIKTLLIQVKVNCRVVLVSVNFVCFSPIRFPHYHCNAMRKAIKTYMNWYKIQQNEHISER